MGRPRKSEPRDQQLNLSLTVTEFQSLCRRAEACGMRPVHYGRSLILQGRGPRIPVDTDNGAGRLIHIQLVRLGNNLNQLVRQHHAGRLPVRGNLITLLEEIRRLIAQVPR